MVRAVGYVGCVGFVAWWTDFAVLVVVCVCLVVTRLLRCVVLLCFSGVRLMFSMFNSVAMHFLCLLCIYLV